MTEVAISSVDVKDVAMKLDALNLVGDERLLLSAIVNTGTKALTATPPPLLNKLELNKSFADQFDAAFKPGVPPANGGAVLKIRG